MTFIDDSKFMNNFGEYGAAINFNKGGGLYISDSEFSLVHQDDQIRELLENTTDSAELFEILFDMRE